MAGKARGEKGTVQRQTWQLLLDNGPMTQPQIRHVTSRTRKSVNNCLVRLIQRGSVEATGVAPKTVYKAVPGMDPTDLRPLNHLHLPKDGRNLPRPHFGKAYKQNMDVVQRRREGTSSEIPQIPSLAALLP